MTATEVDDINQFRTENSFMKQLKSVSTFLSLPTKALLGRQHLELQHALLVVSRTTTVSYTRCADGISLIELCADENLREGQILNFVNTAGNQSHAPNQDTCDYSDV